MTRLASTLSGCTDAAQHLYRIPKCRSARHHHPIPRRLQGTCLAAPARQRRCALPAPHGYKSPLRPLRKHAPTSTEMPQTDCWAKPVLHPWTWKQAPRSKSSSLCGGRMQVAACTGSRQEARAALTSAPSSHACKSLYRRSRLFPKLNHAFVPATVHPWHSRSPGMPFTCTLLHAMVPLRCHPKRVLRSKLSSSRPAPCTAQPCTV